MDYNKRFDQIESILTDVLRVQDRLVAGQERLATGQEQVVKTVGLIGKTVDRMGLVVEKMLDVMIETRDEIKGLRLDHERWNEHERRIRKIEQILDIKGE